MTGLEDYTSTLQTSEDGKTFTFTNTTTKTVVFSKRSITGSEELPAPSWNSTAFRVMAPKA